MSIYSEAIADYAARGAARDQTLLVSLLREIQALCGGALTEEALTEIASTLSLKESYLQAIIHRFPSLKSQALRHRLTVCGGASCGSKGSQALRRHIEQAYRVQNGGVSGSGGFQYTVGGCMKQCRNGPCIRWDGQLYTNMTPARLDTLIRPVPKRS